MGQSDRGEQPHLQPTSFAPRPLPSSCSYCRGQVGRENHKVVLLSFNLTKAWQDKFYLHLATCHCHVVTRTKIVLLRISMISLKIIFLQDPGAWWMGQIVSYLLRPRQDLKVYSLVPSLFLSVFKYPEKENTEILRLPIIIQISI